MPIPVTTTRLLARCMELSPDSIDPETLRCVDPFNFPARRPRIHVPIDPRSNGLSLTRNVADGLDCRSLPAYTSIMGNVKGKVVKTRQPPPMPCLCGVLRQASRAVTRIYDEELRGTGLRVTQYTL